jgi:hypothetical protein
LRVHDRGRGERFPHALVVDDANPGASRE